MASKRIRRTMDGKVIPSSNKSNIFAKKSNTSRKPRPKMTLEFTDGKVTGTKRVPSNTSQNKKAKQSLTSVERKLQRKKDFPKYYESLERAEQTKERVKAKTKATLKPPANKFAPALAQQKNTSTLKTLGKVAKQPLSNFVPIAGAGKVVSKLSGPVAIASGIASMVDYGKRVVEEPKLTEKDRKAKRERFGSIRKKAKEGRNDEVLSFEEQTDPKIPQRPKVRKDDSTYNAVRRNQGYVKRGDVFEPNSGGFPNILGRGFNTVVGLFSDKTKKAIDTTKEEDAQYKKEMTILKNYKGKKYNIPKHKSIANKKKAKEGRNDVDLLPTR